MLWLDNCAGAVQGASNGGRRCEICLAEYKISYEFETIPNIIRKGINYAMSDQKRLLRGGIYGLYLWIFFRRFF